MRKAKEFFALAAFWGLLFTAPLMAEHYYGALFAKKTPYMQQAYIANEKISRFIDNIAERWDEGYFASDIHYARGIWMVAMSKDGKKHIQRIVKTREWDDFVAFIRKSRKEGYELIGIEGGDGYLVGLFEKGAYPTKLVKARYWDDILPVLIDHMKRGYRIVDLEPYAAEVYAIFSKDNPYEAQAYALLEEWEDDDIPIVPKEIRKRWKKGYNLKQMEYGYGRWFLYFVKEKSDPGEKYVIRDEYDDFVRSIKKEWSNGYKIIDFFDGY